MNIDEWNGWKWNGMGGGGYEIVMEWSKIR